MMSTGSQDTEVILHISEEQTVGHPLLCTCDVQHVVMIAECQAQSVQHACRSCSHSI